MAIFQKHPRTLSFLEIFPPLIIFFLGAWVFRPNGNSSLVSLSYLLGAFFIIAPFFIHREPPAELGIRFDNILKGIWKIGLILYVFMEVIVLVNDHYKFPIGVITLKRAGLWFLWATLQQFLVQSFFYLRLKRAFGNRYVPILGAALIFSAIHAMNVPLMIITFFGGLVLSYLFSVNRNVFQAGISHALISILVQAYLCPWVIPDMLIGYRPVFQFTDYRAYGKGVKVAAGDVNGDGKIELVVARGPHQDNDSLIKVLDLKGRELSRFLAFEESTGYGANIALGDINGDGAKEIICGTGVSPSNKAAVRVFDWKGKRISSFRAFNAWKDCGVSVASGDIDNDGKAEILAGIGPGLYCLPELRIFTPRGRMIKRLFPFNNKIKEEGRKRWGLNASCGNLYGDKREELIAGLSYLEQDEPYFMILDQNGKETGILLAFEGRFGGVTLNSGDINGDGYDEIIVSPGSHQFNPASLKVIDGKLRTLYDLNLYPGQYAYGLNLASADTDGDGKEEIITGLGPGPDYPAEVSIIQPTGFHSFRVIARFRAF